ncbi:MAG: hypothetical protein NZ901_04135 [Geminocystis sp.]|nr:hypothetical protein [Geminocystis sp.]HIK38550.1 hypothetical protein [Geminocystis sp. M7585_C2015_104]MCS7147361.1 hypothetical protein [Geminocystis sp.]MCX8079057.1 hypothetical protein [Geminocystis sp.]MDW8116360.1 hypothetical protein [Geminocystis sp.]
MVKELGEYVGWPGLEKWTRNSDLAEGVKEIETQHTAENHKDIIDDEKCFSVSSLKCTNISCEEQVNRLTAQLTAAYYRIASLEEELLTLRHRLEKETGNHNFHHPS